jgi:hypothetical protein
MKSKTTKIYPKTKTIRPYDPIWQKYVECYMDKFGIKPEINYGKSGTIIRARLRNHSIRGLMKIIEMFFVEEQDNRIVPDLITILSPYYINKYATKLKLDPRLYSNARDWNKEVY